MENKNDISCKEVQQSLLEHNNIKTNKRIGPHLESCEKCREFHQLLLEISESTQVNSDTDLQPDPGILRTLKENFELSNNRAALKQVGSLFESLTALFRKRIPVYQVMVAVFIAGIFYFSYSKLDLFKPHPDKQQLISQSLNPTVQPVEFPVQTPLDQDRQIGKSLAEDSVLAKFRVSIL